MAEEVNESLNLTDRTPWLPGQFNNYKYNEFIYYSSLSNAFQNIDNESPGLPNGEVYFHKIQQQFQESIADIKSHLFDNENVDNYDALQNLKNLYQQERAKEVKYLEECGFTIPNENNWSSVVKLLTQAHTSQGEFAYMAEQIRKLAERKGKSRFNQEQFFGGYMYTFLNKKINNISLASASKDILEDKMTEWFKEALISSFNMHGNDPEHNKNDYEKILTFLQSPDFEEVFNSPDNPLRELYQEFVDTWKDMTDEKIKAADENRKANYRQAKARIINNNSFIGKSHETMEYIREQIFGKSLRTKWTGRHTGGRKFGNAKADNTFTVGFDLDEETWKLLEDPERGILNKSVREGNLSRMEQFIKRLQELGKKGTLIFVSDKMYSFSSNFRGYQLQGATNLHNAAPVIDTILRRSKISDITVQEILWVLSNYNGRFLVGDATDPEGRELILRFLIANIAYWMFDDIGLDISGQMEQDVGVNTIHLFNLNNFYVPLSFVLESVYNALKMSLSDAMQFITVRYKPRSVEYQSQPVLTKSMWEQEREQQYSQSTLSFHFLRNFVTEINNILKSATP